MKPKIPLACSQQPPIIPILTQTNLVHTLSPTFFRVHLILSSHLCLSFPGGLYPSGLSTLSLQEPLLYTIHATFPANFILTEFFITKIIFVRSTNHETVHYAMNITKIKLNP